VRRQGRKLRGKMDGARPGAQRRFQLAKRAGAGKKGVHTKRRCVMDRRSKSDAAMSRRGMASGRRKWMEEV